MRELLEAAGGFILTCTAGLAELAHNEAKKHRFPKSLLLRIAIIPAGGAGFYLGLIVVGLGATAGILITISSWFNDRD